MSACAPYLGQPFEAFIKPKRLVNVVFLHCTAASNPAVDAKTVNEWHLQNGWDCIGYHYLIRTDGVIEHGRDLERTPSAQSGYNTGSIAICLNGLKPQDFTDKQYVSLKHLCMEINVAYGGKMRFRGHKEVSAKECPVFDYRFVLGLDANGCQTEAVPALPPESSPIPLTEIKLMLAVIGKGDRHTHVGLAQRMLGVYADDIFGPVTEDACKRFQLQHNLAADGIIGRQTWAALFEDMLEAD